MNIDMPMKDCDATMMTWKTNAGIKIFLINKSSHFQIIQSRIYASNSPAIKFKLLIVITASLNMPPLINSGYAW